MKKIFKIFISWWLIYKLWRRNKKFEKELKREVDSVNLDSVGVYQVDEEQKIQEGIYNLKESINAVVKDRTSESYDKVLSRINNMVDFAKGKTTNGEQLLANLRKKILVFKEKDVRSKKDKIKMVDTRIKHYKELHKHKKLRDLRRQIRQAHNKGDTNTAQQLEEEWKVINGRY